MPAPGGPIGMPRAGPARQGENGTEVFLSLVDEAFDPVSSPKTTLSVDILCLNRDLPSRLPFGGGHPHLSAADSSPAIDRVLCLTPPTPTLRPALGKRGRWRLVSHLALNHLSLTDDTDGIEALREILKLYDFRDSPETRAVIDSLLKVSGRRGSARLPGDALGGFAQGRRHHRRVRRRTLHRPPASTSSPRCWSASSASTAASIPSRG